MSSKTCKICGRTKPLEAFRNKRLASGNPGKSSGCKECLNSAQNALKAAERSKRTAMPTNAAIRAAQALQHGAGEEWRDIDGWPEYEVSNYGFVRRVTPAFGTKPGKRQARAIGSHGYYVVSLARANEKKHDALVHRLVAAAFIGPLPAGMQVCHNDGGRLTSFVSNLRIDTPAGNASDRVGHGTENRGERCGSNKYSRDRVLEVRSMFDGGATITEIARKFDMPQPTVRGMAKRQIWSWL